MNTAVSGDGTLATADELLFSVFEGISERCANNNVVVGKSANRIRNKTEGDFLWEDFSFSGLTQNLCRKDSSQ